MEPKDQSLMNDGIIEALTCPICCIKYNNNDRCAVVLPCGHTFCSVCMKSFQKKCAQCRTDFLDSQVTKNYVVHTILDQMSKLIANNSQKNIIQKETCPTHKREIDRFCKGRCTQLMCSVCHCPHFGDTRNIISDVNFREEIQNMLEYYKDVEKTKKELNQRINKSVETEIQKVGTLQTQRTEEIKNNANAEIQKVTAEKETMIKEAEQDAKQRIQQIELNKLKIIKLADEAAKTKIKEIEDRTRTLLEELNSVNKAVSDWIWKTSREMKQKIDALQDLTKFNKDSLAECVTIYKLEAQQRLQLREFFMLSKSDIESMFKPNQSKEDSIPQRNNSVEKQENVREDSERFSHRGGHGMRGMRGMRARGNMRGGYRGIRGRGRGGHGGYGGFGHPRNEGQEGHGGYGGYGGHRYPRNEDNEDHGSNGEDYDEDNY